MSATEYPNLLERASRLDARAQVDLLADLAILVRDGARPRKRRDIMEFEGIAEGTWKNTDVKEYLDRERGSWDG